MSKIVLKSLSVLLGLFFIFLGTLKLTPKISRDLHKGQNQPNLRAK
jgi:hypothetical protein